MMTTTGSIPMPTPAPTLTYTFYFKGSSHGQLKSTDHKMLEVIGNDINVISPLFQVNYSDMVTVNTEKNSLIYRKGALKKSVDLNNIEAIKKFVGTFFCIKKGDSHYYWEESELEPNLKSEDQVDLQEHEEVVPRASSSSAAYSSLPSQTDYHVDEDKKGKRVAQGVLDPSLSLSGSEKSPKFQKGHKGRKGQVAENDASSLEDDASFARMASSKK